MTNVRQKSDVTNHLEVDGVVLSPKALDMLRHWQADGNRVIEDHELGLYKVITFFARIMATGFVSDDELPEVREYVGDLALLVNNLKDIHKC